MGACLSSNDSKGGKIATKDEIYKDKKAAESIDDQIERMLK